MRFSGLWRHPDFMKLWMGQTISQLGSRVSREAIPLIAVLVLSATPSQMGILTAANAVPPLLLALVAGVWVDRLPRRPILIAADVLRLLVLLIIPAAALTDHLSLPLLVGVVIAMGVLTLFFDTAYHAILPSLIPRENLIEGNSKLATTDALAEIGGPTLSGVLVTVIGAPLAIVFDAISFLFSLIGLAAIRTPEPMREADAEQADFRAEIREGWQIIRHNPVLRTLAIAGSLRTFFGSFYGALYGLFVIKELGLSPALLGLCVSAGGIGGVIGAMLCGWVSRRFGMGRTLVFALLVSNIGGLLTITAGGSPLLATAMLFTAQLIGDGLGTIYFINEMSLRQLLVPDRLLGRANATTTFLSQVIAPLGGLFVAANLIDSARGTLTLAALGFFVTALFVACSPVRALSEVVRVDAPSPLVD